MPRSEFKDFKTFLKKIKNSFKTMCRKEIKQSAVS